MRRILAGGVVAVVAALSLCACGSPAPSAQCRSQVAEIVRLQNAAAQAENQLVSVGSGAQFQAAVRLSGSLLKAVKREGCPNSGYAGGYTIGG